MSAAIRAERVTKYFGDFPAVRDVSFEARQGSTLALLGRNGAGKTTMLAMLAGLSRPSSGVIEIAGVGADGDPRRQIGVIGHGQWLYDELTAEENLRFFAQLYNVEDPEPKIEAWLEDTGLGRFRKSRVDEFSRGMRQRLAVARAFLHDPAVLLLDEPWTSLDDRAIRFLSDRILAAQARKRTIVVCSHQLVEALEVATDVAVLDRGRLVFIGPNSPELRESPATFYERVS